MIISVKASRDKSMPPDSATVAPGTRPRLGPGIIPAKVINFMVINFIEHSGKKDYHINVLENLLRVLVIKRAERPA